MMTLSGFADVALGGTMNVPDLNKLCILHYPDPVLKKMCAEVDTFDADLNALAQRMLALMRQAEGVGLAAPQVGVPIRLFVCNTTGEEGDDRVFVNPKLSEMNGVDEREEGCLSLPGVDVTMRRATVVNLEAMNLERQVIHESGSELQARVWQHEIDHLSGKLIIDNMSTTDEIANRRALKQLEADYVPARRA